MKTKQILAGIGLILAVLTFWVAVPLVVPVLFIGAAGAGQSTAWS